MWSFIQIGKVNSSLQVCIFFLFCLIVDYSTSFLLSYCWTGSSLVHYWLSFLFYTVEKKLDELSFWHFLFPLSLSLFFGTFLSLFHISSVIVGSMFCLKVNFILDLEGWDISIHMGLSIGFDFWSKVMFS